MVEHMVTDGVKSSLAMKNAKWQRRIEEAYTLVFNFVVDP